MSRHNEVGSHRTSVYNANSLTCVKYHRTDVVKFSHNKIILDSGGWQTKTTKLRMNQTSNQYGLNYSVYQKNFEWFVEFKDITIPFFDGMELYKEFRKTVHTVELSQEF